MTTEIKRFTSTMASVYVDCEECKRTLYSTDGDSSIAQTLAESVAQNHHLSSGGKQDGSGGHRVITVISSLPANGTR